MLSANKECRRVVCAAAASTTCYAVCLGPFAAHSKPRAQMLTALPSCAERKKRCPGDVAGALVCGIEIFPALSCIDGWLHRLHGLHMKCKPLQVEFVRRCSS